MDITNRHIQMLDPRGFDQLFEQERLDYSTDKEAFWALNEGYKAAFGMYRYKNYESYRVTRHERIAQV